MQKTARLILIATAALFFILPALLYISFQVDFPDEQSAFSTFIASVFEPLGIPAFSAMIEFFREVYFTLLPGLTFICLAILNFDRLRAEDSKEWSKRDFFWLGLFILTMVVYIVVYSSAPDSVFFAVQSIIPPLGSLAPDLYTFFLWHSFFFMVIASMFVFHLLNMQGFDKNNYGALMIGVLVSFLFSILLVKVPFFNTFEEIFVSTRFSVLRNPGASFHPGSGLQYCKAPYDESGQQIGVFAPNPPGVRDDIEIVGISNKTIEESQGNWPLDWAHYANLVTTLSGAKNSIVLFDISFVDNKGVYGGNYCGSLFTCTPMAGKPLRNQVDVLAEAVKKAENTVLSDYPMETTDEARAYIVNYDERMAVLREKSKLTSVKHGSYGEIWAKLPLPTVAAVAGELDNLGYANILKNEDTGLNRHVPLVVRLRNEERATQPDYNPDVDDEFFAGIDLIVIAEYYGIDVRRDVDVDWLRGTITLKNIPERTFQKFNSETFEQQTVDIMAKPNADRTVIIPINRRGQMAINFRGGRYCFKFKELLETNRMDSAAAAQNFENKIILTAMYYATGVGTAKDMHLSPYGDMAGIEHHAYALNTMLEQDFIKDAPPLVNLLILLVIGIIMGLYQPRVPTWMSFVLALLIAAVYSLLTLYVTFDYLNIIHVFPTVVIEQLFIMVGFIGFRVLTEEENVKFIRNTFSKFVSQDVVDELLANPEAIALGGAKKEITVFFSDVRGFTTISEKLSPEELVQLLNDYLSEMTELIIQYRGTIDKYMGDAIMAFWGAPIPNDQHAYFACVASIAQYRKLKELQEKWKGSGTTNIDIGIGLNSGFAVVGNMGSSHRMDYTVMGDTVNLGSRLEGITKTYGVKICLSEFTYELVKDKVYARELDLVKVKGKNEPVRIYELMGLVNDADVEGLKKGRLAAKAG